MNLRFILIWIILPTPPSPKWYLFKLNFVCISDLFHAYYMFLPSYPPSIYNLNKTWWIVQIVMYFLQPPFTFCVSGRNNLLNTLFSNTPNLYISLRMRDFHVFRLLNLVSNLQQKFNKFMLMEQTNCAFMLTQNVTLFIFFRKLHSSTPGRGSVTVVYTVMFYQIETPDCQR
jgi:hypothetical protein